MTVDEMIEALEDMASQEGTELGEYWMGLCAVAGVRHYAPLTFANQIEQEIQDQYDWAMINFEWVEEEVTYTRKKRTLESKT